MKKYLFVLVAMLVFIGAFAIETVSEPEVPFYMYNEMIDTFMEVGFEDGYYAVINEELTNAEHVSITVYTDNGNTYGAYGFDADTLAEWYVDFAT